MGALTDPLRHPLLDRTFFPPRPARPADPTYIQVSGARLACWRTPGSPMVLVFQGGETVAEGRRGVGAELQAMGTGVFLAGRRGAGGSTGKQTFATLLDDAEALLAATGAAPATVVAFGRSLGSLAAIELASRHALRGLIIESGIADVAEHIRTQVAPSELGITAKTLDLAVHERYDHEHKLARHRAPILVLCSGKDERVDRTHAARLTTWAGSEEKELVVFPRGGHASVFAENRAAYVQALRRFLARR